MVWWLFNKKKGEELEKKLVTLHSSLEQSFLNIRRDLHGVGDWISHFKNKHDDHDEKLKWLDKRVKDIEGTVNELRSVWTSVQTPVQTATLSKQIQTDSCPNTCPSVSKHLSKQQKKIETINQLKNLTMMERALVWVLLNTDLKLSYEDLSIALGKDQSTLRGQINSVKNKSGGLIRETSEREGKKRFFVDEKVKNEILKGSKRRGELVQKVTQKVKKSKK